MNNLRERLEAAGAVPSTVGACLRIYDHLGQLAADEPVELRAMALERRELFFERVIAVAACGDLRSYTVRNYAGYITRSVGIAFQMLVDGLCDPDLGDLRLTPDGRVFANWNQIHRWKERCYRRLP